ncbi:MAG: polysaccharide biosynthesis tyrosine autokinase, partial [Desulfobacteraceae bacterium]|nr:polysaccharide biosynthesis tyrosine autokinase [Desulfobacteraceae bacterium]
MVIEREQIISPLTGERLDYDTHLAEPLIHKTHSLLLLSYPLLERVINELKLDQLNREKDSETNSIVTLISGFLKNFLMPGKKKEEPLTDQEHFAKLIENLKKKISIKEVRNTLLLTVTVEDHNPVLAMNIANSLCRTYIKFDNEERVKESRDTFNMMTVQLDEMRAKLEAAEQAFLFYKEDEKLFSVEGKQKSISQKIENINQSFITTRNQRLELEARLKKLKSGRTLKTEKSAHYIRSLLENLLIDHLYGELVAQKIELFRLRNVFGYKHPKIIQLESKIENITKELETEFKKELENMKAKRDVLFSREKALQETISDFETEALETNRKELGYLIHQRNVETNQKLYNTLLAKIKETQVTTNITISNIRIKEKAVKPVKPSSPKKALNIILGTILGLLIGIFLALLSWYWDKTLHTETDIQRYMNLPVLSVIPEIKRGRIYDVIKKSELTENTLFAEAYRTFEFNLNLSFVNKNFESLLITSAGEKEGRTSAVVNLGHIMSRLGKTVLMIDADLRKSTLSRLISSQESPGLTELLSMIEPCSSGKNNAEHNCRLTGKVENLPEMIHSSVSKISDSLFLLPAGPFPPNPGELLHSDRIAFLLSVLKKQFNFLLIDSPPLLPGTGVLSLASQTDGVVLMVKPGFLNRDILIHATEQIRLVQANLVGVILNQVNIKKEGYYSYSRR